MTYSEKLKDPRWQKKRLEIMSRDDFTCRKCKDKESTLHVHHFYYENGKDPWDYENDSLITYCERCHQIMPEVIARNEELLLMVLRRHGFTPAMLFTLERVIENMYIETNLDHQLIALNWVISEKEVIKHIIDKYNEKKAKYEIL